MYGCQVSVGKIPLAAYVLRMYRKDDWKNKARCPKHYGKDKGRYLADGKELERDCQAVGK